VYNITSDIINDKFWSHRFRCFMKLFITVFANSNSYSSVTGATQSVTSDWLLAKTQKYATFLSSSLQIHYWVMHKTYLCGIRSPHPGTNCGRLVIHSSARNINKPITQSSAQLHTQNSYHKMPIDEKHSSICTKVQLT